MGEVLNKAFLLVGDRDIEGIGEDYGADTASGDSSSLSLVAKCENGARFW